MHNRIHQPRNGSSLRTFGARGFTLVELLVVVGLMAVILTITITNFMMSSGGAKAQSALVQLKSTLALARQYAITRREPIFVVFPETTNTFETVEQRNALAYQAYNVWSPSGGYMGEWKVLPRGLYFDKSASGSGAYNIFTSTKDSRFAVTNVLPSSLAMPCVSFVPNGRLNQTGGTTLEVFVAEGAVDVSNPDVVITQANRRVQSLVIKPLTGIMSFKEY